MDKGKSKMIESEKPKNTVPFPLQIGGAFKIHDKDSTPLALAVALPAKMEKKPTKAPPRVARLLKLVDKEDNLEAGKPVEATLVPVIKTPTLN